MLVSSISQNEVWIKKTFNVELQITHLSGSKKVLRKNFQRNRGKKEIKVSERRKWEWEKEDRKERKKEKKGRDFTGRWSTNHTSTKEEHDSLFSLFYDLWRRVSETFSLRWMEKETENWKRERETKLKERERTFDENGKECHEIIQVNERMMMIMISPLLWSREDRGKEGGEEKGEKRLKKEKSRKKKKRVCIKSTRKVLVF